MKGRKRHIVVDTDGRLVAALVHAADVPDRDGARPVLRLARAKSQRLARVWHDGAYVGDLADWAAQELDLTLEHAVRATDTATSGFVVQPRRWVVERSFAWFGRYRRLSKDYEEGTDSSHAWLCLAMIHIFLRRLAPGVHYA